MSSGVGAYRGISVIYGQRWIEGQAGYVSSIDLMYAIECISDIVSSALQCGMPWHSLILYPALPDIAQTEGSRRAREKTLCQHLTRAHSTTPHNPTFGISRAPKVT